MRQRSGLAWCQWKTVPCEEEGDIPRETKKTISPMTHSVCGEKASNRGVKDQRKTMRSSVTGKSPCPQALSWCDPQYKHPSVFEINQLRDAPWPGSKTVHWVLHLPSQRLPKGRQHHCQVSSKLTKGCLARKDGLEQEGCDDRTYPYIDAIVAKLGTGGRPSSTPLHVTPLWEHHGSAIFGFCTHLTSVFPRLTLDVAGTTVTCVAVGSRFQLYDEGTRYGSLLV
jgi:hypothetical protein